MNVPGATNDLSGVMEEAERAAAGGDYVTAAQLLQDVASRQEANLGSLHPDLANTFNNLAVVYETLNQPADAEDCYRRAYAIASTALDPAHPFVATSEKNYRDFWAARGLAFEPVTRPAPVAPEPPAPEALVLPRSIQPPVARAEAMVPPPSAVRNTSRVRALTLAGIMAFATTVAVGLRFGTNPEVEFAQAVASASPRETNVPAHPLTPAGAARPARNPAQPIVDAVTLCRDLSRRDWHCQRATRPVRSGPLFFYTRIKAPTNVTVEHRWYRDDRVHRVVTLRVQPNQRNGFRTYSRTAVKRGDWRVELRTSDGAVLHSERFVVR